MTISADTLRRLSALQLAPEAMQEVLAIISSCIEPLEERRRRDRDRKKAVRGNSADIPQTFRGKSMECPAEIPRTSSSAYIEDNSSLRKERKKEKRSIYIDATEIPETIPGDARAYALSKGWDARKAETEWQRFRDHSLNKGRKHRNLLAAWRNWVTSPYQTNGTQNGSGRQSAPDKSVSAAADRVLEKLCALNEPIGSH